MVVNQGGVLTTLKTRHSLLTPDPESLISRHLVSSWHAKMLSAPAAVGAATEGAHSLDPSLWHHEKICCPLRSPIMTGPWQWSSSTVAGQMCKLTKCHPEKPQVLED